MTFLLTTLFTTTSVLLVTPIVALAAMLMLGVSLMPRRRQDANPSQLDHHTLADIGIEPGSITWMR